jgi:hypothetical protein
VDTSFELNRKAWEVWIQYRKDIRKPLKQASLALAQKKLASFGDSQMQVVENSIANGWTGLFPPAKEKGAFRMQQSAHREDREFERLRARAAKVGFRQPYEGEDLIGFKTLLERAEWNHQMGRPLHEVRA